MDIFTNVRSFFRCKSGAVGGEWIGISAILFAVGLGLAVTTQGTHGGVHQSSINFSKPTSDFSLSGILETLGFEGARTVVR